MSVSSDNSTATDGSPPAPSNVRVYVNEQGVSVTRGATALDAVRAMSGNHAAQIEAGTARITDSRGLPIDAQTIVSGGTILRIVALRERDREVAE